METKDLIRQAATQEFATHGFQGARIGAIVKAAQINERMIYHYFGSKEGLYKAVLEAEWLGVASSWQPAVTTAPTRPAAASRTSRCTSRPSG